MTDPDHLALASEWAMEADDLVRNMEYETESGMRVLNMTLVMAQVHAQVASTQAAVDHAKGMSKQVVAQQQVADGLTDFIAHPAEEKAP